MLQRRITAYHEAAHVVMAFKLGIPVGEVKICKTGPVLGYVDLPGAPLIPASSTTLTLCRRGR